MGMGAQPGLNLAQGPLPTKMRGVIPQAQAVTQLDVEFDIMVRHVCLEGQGLGAGTRCRAL